MEALIGGSLLDAFRDFCDLWASRYDWANAERLRAYLFLCAEERTDLYRRFARECRIWEETLRLAVRRRPLPVSRDRAASAGGREGWRRRRQQLEQREARLRGFYDRLAGEIRTGARAASMPWMVRRAFEVLGLPAGSPMEEVRKAYRRLAFVHHPDRRGDHLAMADLNRAYRRIREHYRSL